MTNTCTDETLERQFASSPEVDRWKRRFTENAKVEKYFREHRGTKIADGVYEHMSTMKRNKELEKKLIDASEKIQLMKREKEPEEPPKIDPSKCCPICGGNDFETVRKSNGILGPGGRSWPLYYICTECSVMFRDPNKFFRKWKQPNLRLHELMTI